MTLFKADNGLEYYTLNNSGFNGTIHGFFTRKGGVSKGHYHSLNLGGSIGDDPGCVRENKRRVFEAVQRKPGSVYEVWQVHSRDIVCTENPLGSTEQRLKADGIFTSNPNVTLLMRFADCVPILFFDPKKRVIGIVHAGWLGTVNRIVENALVQAKNHFGCRPEDFVVGIGPSIGPDHYEIGNDVIQKISNTFNAQADEVLISRHERVFLDLWKANSILLANAGINKILNDNICTACDTDKWFSHRAEKGKTGRFGAIIGMKQE